jgi:threonine dehydratase
MRSESGAERVDRLQSVAQGNVKLSMLRSCARNAHVSILNTQAEYKQFTGSFKERGARNALLQLSEEQRRRGVIAASAGNHALGLAYHSK